MIARTVHAERLVVGDRIILGRRAVMVLTVLHRTVDTGVHWVDIRFHDGDRSRWATFTADEQVPLAPGTGEATPR